MYIVKLFQVQEKIQLDYNFIGSRVFPDSNDCYYLELLKPHNEYIWKCSIDSMSYKYIYTKLHTFTTIINSDVLDIINLCDDCTHIFLTFF